MSLTPARLDRLAEAMQAYVDRQEIPGLVLLLHQHDVTWVHHHGVRDLETRAPMTNDTIFRIASMTKPVIAAATMHLVDDKVLDLDAPVDPWLPELANRQVVRSVTGPLDDTVPATRPITTRQLLTLTWGLGALMREPGESPLQDAMDELGVGPGPFQPAVTPDAFLAAIGSLPLAHQPGEGWLYHTGFDVLPILLQRITGQPVVDFMRERLFEPLGMADTGFVVPAQATDRLATAYGMAGDSLVVADTAEDGRWTREPGVPTELVSTATDYLAFARCLLDEGDAPGGRVLTAGSVREMTHNHISPEIKRDFPFYPGFWDGTGWGYGVSVRTSPPDAPGLGAGSYGWAGGFNTHWQNDPATGLVAMLFTQRLAGGPADEGMISTFWRLVAEALHT